MDQTHSAFSNEATDYRLAIVIPCYNHGSTLAAVVASLAHLGLTTIIVDDGSNDATRTEIDRVAATAKDVVAVHLPENRGKGGAVLAGLEKAAELGFTHALQIDSDGQHNVADSETMIGMSKASPADLISGRPVYDESVPKKRLIGRYITHFWVWVETWSFAIKDSLCGFRIYPLARTLAAAHLYPIGLRMDFDPEIMVRFYWLGGNVQFLPTKVVYPVGGISHFNLVRDNVQIAKMHTKLFFRSLVAMPRRFWCKARGRDVIAVGGQHTGNKESRSEPEPAPSNPSQQHWAQQTERRAIVGILGFQCLYGLYRLGGRALFNATLLPVLGVFWLTGRGPREAVKAFLARVNRARVAAELPATDVRPFDLYKTFGTSILDRLLAWRGEMTLGDGVRFADDASRDMLVPTMHRGRGKLLLVSHLGVPDVCRAVAAIDRDQVVNVLMFERHAQQFKRMMEKTAPQSQLHIIAVDNIGPETSAQLADAIERGEWIAIAADRVPVEPGRTTGNQASNTANTTPVSFLGETARFPIGPYVLAHLLRVDVVTLFALREGRAGKEILIFAEPFTTSEDRPKRSERDAFYQRMAQKYAERLGSYAMRYPANWFNFYDFWGASNNA